jgi:hypothetical protein
LCKHLRGAGPPPRRQTTQLNFLGKKVTKKTVEDFSHDREAFISRE